MAVLVEIVFEVLGELVLQFIAEGLVEWGFHGTAEKLSTGRRNRVFAGAAYVVFGTVIGWLSLFVFPPIVFADKLSLVIYVVFASAAAGFALSAVSWLINRGIRPANVFEVEKFVYGVIFAFSYMAARAFLG